MRKYTQLGLVVVCVVSVMGLLIMERQYSNMKVFLEVTDIFQTSESNAKCVRQLESLRATLEGEYLDTIHKVDPSWDQIGMSTFLYSSFYAPASQLVTILLVSDVRPKTCRLWLDPDTSQTVEASVEVLASSSSFSALAVGCINPNNSTRPQAVEIFGSIVPIEEQLVHDPHHVGICVHPLTFNTTEVKLAEFLAYHSHIGVDRFYVYDANLSPQAKTFVRRAPYIQPDLITHLLQWNAPVSIGSLSEPILKADCLLRAGLDSKYVAMLSINEFFVLRRKMANMTAFLATVIHDDQVLAVHERTFCDEYPDDVIASALKYPFSTLRKTKFNKNTKQHRVTFVPAGNLTNLASLAHSGVTRAEETSFVSEETAHMNVYTSCAGMHNYLRKKNLQIPTDTFLTGFHEQLFGSKLYKFTLHRKSPVYHLIA
ncbi:uncharacterized protein LOC100904763 [Galendromus occidentalis]|uniref:Glycosyltransferase family 92 protein n=1 Tax=Galendromus occidentalis TaxID=34638 RepID=A0AAJ6QU62_9ACAR|nr:uncharacterized protein LOC100904763 [Galendromus occidentalis]XP_018495379.1 uncharacterized protein LOC100904763 [Galendromus occidentalis]